MYDGYGCRSALCCWTLLPAVKTWLASLRFLCLYHVCRWTSTAEAFYYEPFMANIRMWQVTRHHWVALTVADETLGNGNCISPLSVFTASFANTRLLKFANICFKVSRMRIYCSCYLKHLNRTCLVPVALLQALTRAAHKLQPHLMFATYENQQTAASQKGSANGKDQSRTKNSIQQ